MASKKNVFPASAFRALCLGLALLAPPVPIAIGQPNSQPSSGNSLSIDGSGSMAALNQALKQGFEQENGSRTVTIQTNGTSRGLQALAAGQVDLAAIGRALTPAEVAQGFVAIPLQREKIAMIVSADNPYSGNMNIAQFAQMFRGEIKDWSELGRTPGPVRFVDQPDDSDTRNAFANYPAFQSAPFQSGSTTIKAGDESVGAIVKTLGKDGISYVIANQAKALPGTKIVQMHATLPDDPRYPFSHGLAYVYKKGQLSPAAAAFLGYVAQPGGKEALKIAGTTGATPIDPKASIDQAIAAGIAVAPIATPTPTPTPAIAPVVPSSPAVPQPVAEAGGVATSNAPAAPQNGWVWWLLLPLGLGILIWALKKRGRDEARTETPIAQITAEPPVVIPPTPSADFEAITQLPADNQEPLEFPLADDDLGVSDDFVTVAIDDMPRGVEGVGLAGVGLAGAGLAASTIAPTFFVENPNVDDMPRQASDPIDPIDQVNQTNNPNQLSNLSQSPRFIPASAVGPTSPAGPSNEPTQANDLTQSNVEASKYSRPGYDQPGYSQPSSSRPQSLPLSMAELATTDDGLPELAGGYGSDRIVLMSRDPQWAYSYWDISNEFRQQLRDQGGKQLAIRIYDITDIDLDNSRPHTMQQYAIDETTQNYYMPIPVSDRDYIAEIGYTTNVGTWLRLARSNTMRIPPVYPADWVTDQTIDIPWESALLGKTADDFAPPAARPTPPSFFAEPELVLHEQMFNLSMPGEFRRIDGSLFGSMHMSSHLFMSAQSIDATMNTLGLNVSGLNVSGLNVSGLNSFGVNAFGLNAFAPNVSGQNASGSGAWTLPTTSGQSIPNVMLPPVRSPRNFWLVADAVLIVHGATEPDAKLTIDGQPLMLNPDGTFRLQMSFQDGKLQFPVIAVAADGEQTRNVRLDFQRVTSQRYTNPKNEATDEWF